MSMTEQESAQLVEVIEAHWPYPPIDDLAEDAMRRSLDGVPLADVERAVMRLVTSGREHQPRAPHIFKALAEVYAEDRRLAREMAWAERDAQRTLESEVTGVSCPPEVLAKLRRAAPRSRR